MRVNGFTTATPARSSPPVLHSITRPRSAAGSPDAFRSLSPNRRYAIAPACALLGGQRGNASGPTDTTEVRAGCESVESGVQPTDKRLNVPDSNVLIQCYDTGYAISTPSTLRHRYPDREPLDGTSAIQHENFDQEYIQQSHPLRPLRSSDSTRRSR